MSFDNRPNELRALTKGLLCLGLANRQGGISVQECAQSLRMPRTTIFRLFETLRHEGYVTRTDDGNYVPAIGACRLSHGFDEEREWLEAAVKPALADLDKHTRWSIGLATPGRLNMTIRMTTETTNPFAMYRLRPGSVLSLTQSSAGQAYLAHLPPAVRSHMIDLCNKVGPDDIGPDSCRLEDDLSRVAARGFASARVNDMEQAISVPVSVRSRVLGCIGAKYVTRVASKAEVGDIIAELKSIAADAVKQHEMASVPE